MKSKNNKMADAAYEMLCDKILRFELAPGTAVSDHILSQILGMSRTPIREALFRLERDGLVQSDDTNKMYISQATIGDVEEIAQARMAIEWISFFPGTASPTTKRASSAGIMRL